MIIPQEACRVSFPALCAVPLTLGFIPLLVAPLRSDLIRFA